MRSTHIGLGIVAAACLLAAGCVLPDWPPPWVGDDDDTAADDDDTMPPDLAWVEIPGGPSTWAATTR